MGVLLLCVVRFLILGASLQNHFKFNIAVVIIGWGICTNGKLVWLFVSSLSPCVDQLDLWFVNTIMM